MASNDSTSPSGLLGAVGSLRGRYRVFIAAAALVLLGAAASLAWRQTRASMRSDPRYEVTAASIETPPPPPWIRTDIRLEALRDADLRGGLSVLDPPEQLQKRLADAFSFHPWVESVGAITKRPPNRIRVELTYRQPLATVELATANGQRGLVPVDRFGVRLPSAGLTEAELRYLPRVRGIESTTLKGEVWRDARVLGAISLISAYGSLWSRLDLVEVLPSRSTEVHGDLRYYVFDLITTGGTRIVWGAAPNATPPGEAPFAVKLAQLQRFVAENGRLRSTYQTPSQINVRNGLTVTERTAQRTEDEPEASTVKR